MCCGEPVLFPLKAVIIEQVMFKHEHSVQYLYIYIYIPNPSGRWKSFSEDSKTQALSR